MKRLLCWLTRHHWKIVAAIDLGEGRLVGPSQPPVPLVNAVRWCSRCDLTEILE